MNLIHDAMHHWRPYLLILLIFCCTTQAYSQSYNKSSRFRSYWSVNANFGSSIFFGDIKQHRIVPVSNNENEWRFAGGAMLNKQISPIFGIRGQFLYGKLAGTRRPSNLFFESNYIEFNLNTAIGLRNLFQKYRPQQLWNAYIVFGLGLTNFNTELKDLSTKQVVRKIGYGNGRSFGGRTLQGMLIGGMGIDLRLSNHVNIKMETANRILNTDELDGRTSGFKYDVYNYTSFGIAYKFGMGPSKPKKQEEYSFFEKKSSKPRKKDHNVETAEYDFDPTKPVSPPEVDALTIDAAILSVPISPPTEEQKEPKVIITEEVIRQPVRVVEETYVSPAPEMEYRVQIRAKYGNKISRQSLSNSYNIPVSDIKENTHNGFFIYTVGSFNTYEEAKAKRNQLRSYNGIMDAFVVAFENGVRLNKLP